MYPILFHIGKFPIRSYGISILAGFLAGLWLVRRRAAKFGFDAAKVTDLCFYTLIFGILGARVLFLLQDIGYYSKHLNEVFSLEFAGLTSFGGLIAGAAYVIYWGIRHKARLFSLLDLLAPGFMLAHVFGRIGCFLNGCCYGRMCDASFPLATHFEGATGVHQPAQLYDSAMNLVGVGLLLAYERRGFRPGQGVGMFLILHGLARFIYEFWRAGTQREVDTGIASSTYWPGLPITQAQAMALALVLIGGVVWVIAARRPVRPAEPTTEESEPETSPEMQTA